MTTNVVYGVGGYDPDSPTGNVVESVEVADIQQPLDAAGSLATMLAVQGVLSVQDAADAVGLTAADLTAEAQAWAVASSPPAS